MNFHSNTDIIEFVKSLNNRLLSRNLNAIWSGFNKSRFALYNSSHVYLSSSDNNNVEVIEWDQRFAGNTSIKLGEEYIGIWDLNSLSDDITEEVLFSLIVHEIFHGFQTTFSDKPFANELCLLNYPFTKEVVALILAERESLYQAVMEENHDKKIHYLNMFIQFRSNRKELLGEALLYDLGVESHEGTASYVEFKTLLANTNYTQKDLLTKFWNRFYKPRQVLNYYRTGCYATGLFICLLIDYVCVNWHSEFSSSNKNIYDFLLSKFNSRAVELPPIDNELAQSILDSYHKVKDEKFQKFYNSKGKDIVIKGCFELRGFDPMNIVGKGNAILHKHFLMVSDGDNNLMFQGPLISKFEDKMWVMTEIHIKHSETPQLIDGKIHIKGIGNINGTLVN